MNIYPPRWLVNWLVKRAERRPLDFIYDDDGSLYMKRYTLFQFPWVWARIHVTHRSDADPHLHDHPWRNVSWILDGSYGEELPDHSPWSVRLKVRHHGDIIFRGLKFRHRLDIYRAPCISLFITGKYKQSWGFFVDDKKIPWRDYLAQRRQGVYDAQK